MKVRQDAWSHEDDLLLAETVLRHIREGSTQLNAFEEVGDKLNRTSAACGFRWNAEVRKKYHQAMELAKKQRKERKRALAAQAQQISSIQSDSKTQLQVNTSSVQEHTSEMTSNPVTQTHSSYTSKETVDYPSYNYQPQAETLTRQIETKQETSATLNLETVISYLHSIKSFGLNSQILQSENERLTRENKQLLEEKEKIERKLQRLKQENIIIQEDYQALVQIMDRARRMVSFADEAPQNPVVFTNNLDNDFGQIAK